ncbi:hypothetical protein [Variovorax soli]|uniref:Uncharacterized protein n=1 Tax=Variovorax soli TaxID=376815 RepID=A0ABU1NL09_9BURK|nr:hypothetical protein [Variovorax soli]MDR6539112.1 hypothetical protein [Variovorax soli]
MKITIQISGRRACEVQVGTTHHPYAGPFPKVGQTLVIPEDADVEHEAKGKAKIIKILWHYNPRSSALWPEIVCKRS